MNNLRKWCSLAIILLLLVAIRLNSGSPVDGSTLTLHQKESHHVSRNQMSHAQSSIPKGTVIPVKRKFVTSSRRYCFACYEECDIHRCRMTTTLRSPTKKSFKIISGTNKKNK